MFIAVGKRNGTKKKKKKTDRNHKKNPQNQNRTEWNYDNKRTKIRRRDDKTSR